MPPCHFLLNPVLYIIHTVHSFRTVPQTMYYLHHSPNCDTALCTSHQHRHNIRPVSGRVYNTINPQVQFYKVTRRSFLKLKIPRFLLNSFVPVHR